MNTRAFPFLPARGQALAGRLPGQGNQSGMVPDADRPRGAAAKLVHHGATPAPDVEVVPTACPKAMPQLPGAAVPGLFEFGG